MIYFDTSYLVRLYFEDPGWGKVRELAATDQVACGWHGHAETLAAFHRKFREGAIQAVYYQALLGQFAKDNAEDAYHWILQGRDIADRVAQVYGKLPESVSLRAGDAWHLATALQQGLTAIYSNDSRLLAAAPHFHLEGRNVLVA
ncbi:MAG: type II toxin-antitoxin system VapC family toxin [Opitutaceae bacterium]